MTFESSEPYIEPPKPDSSGASLPGYGYMQNYGTARPGTDLFANVDPNDALTGDLLVQKGDAWVPLEDADDHKEVVAGADTDLAPSRPNQQAEVKPETLAIGPSAETEPAFEGFDGNLSDLDKEPGPDTKPKTDSQEPAKAGAGDSRWAEPPDSSTPRRKPRNPLNKLMSEKPESAGKELEITGNNPPTNEPPQLPPKPPENPGGLPPTEPPNLPVKLSPPPPPPVPNVSLELSQKYWSAKDFWLGFGRLALGNFVVGPMATATQKLEARGVVVESKGIFGQTTKYNVDVLNASTGRTTKIIVKGADTPNDAAKKAITDVNYRFAAVMKTI